MKVIMEQHFRELDEAAKTKSQKIAWCTSVGPAELLRAWDSWSSFRKIMVPCSVPPAWPRI